MPPRSSADSADRPADDKPPVRGTAVLSSSASFGSAGHEPTAAATPGARASAKTAASAQPAASLVGRVLDDRYEVISKLGEGAMGVVYEVRHLRLDKRFAMKVIHGELARLPEFIARFEREALACSRMDHPNTISVTDFGRASSGELFLVMEFVVGQPLQELVQNRPLPVRQALETTRQVLLALQQAHAAGVIHRDIKPENIMRVETEDDSWRVKVLDFGIAKAPAGNNGGHLTQAGVIFGTPQYMAPEQAMSATVDARADIYAVGATLWRMLTGRPLFKGAGPVEIISAKLSRAPPELDDVAPGVYSSGLAQLVRRALARRPADRISSADEMLEQVIRIQREEGGGMALRPRWYRGAAILQQTVRLARLSAMPYADWYHAADRWPDRMRALVTTRRGATVVGLTLAAALLALTASMLQLASIPESDLSANLTDGHADTSAPAVSFVAPEQPRSASGAHNKRLIKVRLLLEKNACNEAAVDLLNLVREQPALAEAHYLLGAAEYCRRRYRFALEAYRKAIELEPRYRSDVRVLAHAEQLTYTRKVRDEALRFIAIHLGRAGLPLLVKQASHNRNPGVRHMAITYAAKLGGASRIDWVSSLSLDLKQLPTCQQRCKVVGQLAKLGDPRAVPALRQARDQTVRVRIFSRAWRNGCCRDRIVAVIKKLLKNKKEQPDEGAE